MLWGFIPNTAGIGITVFKKRFLKFSATVRDLLITAIIHRLRYALHFEAFEWLYLQEGRARSRGQNSRRYWLAFGCSVVHGNV